MALAGQAVLHHAPSVTDKPDPDVTSLADGILGAERHPVHSRTRPDHPNPVGGFANILYPVRGYILIAALVLIPVFVLVSVLI